MVIAKDKRGHFWVGFIMSLLVFSVLRLFDVSVINSLASGFIVSIILGVGKELHDAMNPASHNVEFMDFIFTAGGGLLCSIIVGGLYVAF